MEEIWEVVCSTIDSQRNGKGDVSFHGKALMQNKESENEISVKFVVELTRELGLDSGGLIKEPVMPITGSPEHLKITDITDIDIITTTF